jgi:hypothetical protein
MVTPVAARRYPDGHTLGLGRVDAILDRHGVVSAVVGDGAEIDHRKGVVRLAALIGRGFQIDAVDPVEGRGVLHILLQGDGAA